MVTAPELPSVRELTVMGTASVCDEVKDTLSGVITPAMLFEKVVTVSPAPSGRRRPVTESAVAKEVPEPPAVASMIAQGRIPLLAAPTAPF